MRVTGSFRDCLLTTNCATGCYATREWLEFPSRYGQKEPRSMITREEIRELAQLESKSACAVSFYFQPQIPQDKSHRHEVILIKDLVRESLRKAERRRNHTALRED